MDPASRSVLIPNETETLWVAFNGEIYNHRELRAELEKKGHRFATKTDTEVIVHLYEELGAHCVQRLRGMFAFAVMSEQTIFLARDRMGIKPLYYCQIARPSWFVFASEIKALLQCSEVSPRLDVQAFADFTVLSHPVAGDTFLEGVKSLEPGHTMTVSWSEEGLTVNPPARYFFPNEQRDEGIGFSDAQRALEEAMAKAVESHLAADVEVGLTLSGGLDSTLLALLARELRDAPLATFTVADYEQHPDMVQAERIAAMVGARHVPVVMTFADYLDRVPGFIAAEERPSRLYGLPFYVLCATVSRHVKSCLHGEGSDELFGGYEDHLDSTWRTRHLSRRLPLLKRLGVGPSSRLTEILERLFHNGGAVDSMQAIFELNRREPLERHHLDPVDRCSMAFGLEMRVPYLDDDMCELVNRFPLRYLVRADLGIRKYILRRLCLDRFGTGVLDVVLRGKLGVPSAAGRFRSRLKSLCDRVLPDDYLSEHALGFCFESKLDLLTFEMYEEIFLKQRGAADAAGSVLDWLHARSGRTSAAFSVLAAVN